MVRITAESSSAPVTGPFLPIVMGRDFPVTHFRRGGPRAFVSATHPDSLMEIRQFLFVCPGTGQL